MIKIRKGIFETNSSSTHSLIMCSKDEYDLLKNNEAFLVNDEVVKKENLFEKFINKNKYNQKYWKEYCDKYLKNYESLDDLVEMILLDPSSYYDDEDEDEPSRPFDHYDICTLDQFFNNDYLESFQDSYTTKNGEEVIAFGLYGYDG